MVTFVCEYCDLTLKKNQCDKHVAGRCRPASLICIDCSGTFRGIDYKAHTSCISEVDKHWGQYAPSKKGNKNNNSNHPANNNQKKDQKKAEEKQVEPKEGTWMGWKNQIKKAFVEQEKQQVELQTIKFTVLKRYHEQYEQTDKDQKTFMDKLQKLKKMRLTTFVTFN